MWRETPFAAQLGVVVIVLGTLGDVVAHAVLRGAGQGFTVPQQTAHLVILLGMVLTLAGVVTTRRRRPGRDPRVGHSREVTHAARDR